MQNSHRNAVRTSALILLVMAGCATTDYPRNLPSAQDAARATSGSWVVVTTYAGKHEGELVAIDHDSLFLFAEDTLRSIPFTEIRSAKVFASDYPIDPSVAGLWTFLGSLSTASHGAYLIISLPVWLIWGSISASAVRDEADAGDVSYPERSWEEVAAYARFPQGLAPDLDRSQLKPVELKIRPNSARPRMKPVDN